MENTQLDLQEKHNNFDLLEQLFVYLRYWHYFLISVMVCFFVVKDQNYYAFLEDQVEYFPLKIIF